MKVTVTKFCLLMASSLSCNVNAFSTINSNSNSNRSSSTRRASATMEEVSSSASSSTVADVVSKNPMFEYLKFDKSPQYDVLEKAKEYIRCQSDASMSNTEMDESWYAEDYVLRGPVIGPIVRKDLAADQSGLGIRQAFPKVKIDSFGYSIDPENPYRCFYFQRWRGVNSGDMDNYGTVYPATGTEMETPVSTFSVVFNPEGKIVYEQVGAVVDRLEGNTQGKAAIFGMLHTAGLKIPASPGDKVFAFIQRAGHVAGGLGRSWSRKADIPKWWTSKSKGADETEQY